MCAACTPGGAPAPEHPEALRCGCPEPIALRPCDNEDRGDDAILETRACQRAECPGCQLAVAKLVSGDYAIALGVPECRTNAGRTCCPLPPGQRVRIVHRGGFTANSDAPTPPTDLCALPTVPAACAVPQLPAPVELVGPVDKARSDMRCISDVGCPEPFRVPQCPSELTSKCGPLLTSTDLASAPTAATVVVRGLLGRGGGLMTAMACPPMLCCNRAWVHIAIKAGEVQLSDRWNCLGDESLACCPLALPDDPIPVLALGELVELELPRQGRVFEPRALCRLPK